MAVPKKKTSKAKSRSRRASNWVLKAPARSVCPQCTDREAPAHRVSQLRLVQRPSGHRRRLVARGAPRPTGEAFDALPVAVEAMGGAAPGEIVVGARAGRRGGHDRCPPGGPERARMGDTGDLPLLHCTEIIGMDDDPGQGGAAQEGLVPGPCGRSRSATATPWPWCLAGNTGATMASGAVADGQAPGVIRPAIATPIQDLKKDYLTVMLDAGANAEAHRADAGAVRADGCGLLDRTATGLRRPRVALLSIGEEKSKGTPLVKETHALLAGGRTRRLRIRRQRGGPGLLRGPGRRHRDRRVHRQRGPEDARGHAPVPDVDAHRDPPPSPRWPTPQRVLLPAPPAPSPASSTPRRPAGRCSSVSTGCA